MTDQRIEESQGEPGESHKERLDRELIEFLNEVRVVLPGVQVLFAFLLTIAFSGRFITIDGGERIAYVVAFFSTALAAVLMISPTSLHRLRFRKGDKEWILRTSNVLILLGMVFLAIGIVATVWLVAELLFSVFVANVIGILSILIVCGLWIALPLAHPLRLLGSGPND